MEELHSGIHNDILERFKTMDERDTLAHAYLFVGPKEIGKTQTALALAKLLLCETRGKSFCDVCAVCRKIDQGAHPDVFLIQREEDALQIKIEQVRDLLAHARLMPFEAKRKVFIIKNVEEMNAQAANALLKTLEEPTKTSLLILTTAALDNVLETVRSRCHLIPFLPSSTENIIQQLEGEFVESFNAAHFLAYFSEGCLNKAKRLREEDFFALKNDYIDGFIYKAENEELLKDILADKEKTKVFIQIIMSWVRDSLLLKSGVDDARLIHLDRKSDLDDFQARFTFEELNSIYDQCVLSYRQTMDNLNARMSLMILGEMLHD